MACSQPAEHEGRGDAGYATAAAVMISLALAVVATAVTNKAAQALKLAQTDRDNVALQRSLDDAEERAVVALLQIKQTGRLHWTTQGQTGLYDVVAEPEALKLTPSALADLAVNPQLANALGADFEHNAPAVLKDDPYSADLADLGQSPLWRDCAATLISPWGGTTLLLTQATAPTAGPLSWRAGQVWRIRVRSRGWAQDRIVRFTGDQYRPALTVRRRLLRREEGGSECDTLLSPNAST